MKYEGTKLQKFEPRSKVKELEIIDTDPGTGEEVRPGATSLHIIRAHCVEMGSFSRVVMILVMQSHLGLIKSLKAGRSAYLA